MTNLKTVAKKLHDRTDDGLVIGQAIYVLSAFITTDWMDGNLELRFPEVLRSSIGMHYLDHFNPGFEPISEPLPFPVWEKGKDGLQSYVCKLREGMEFSAGVKPCGEDIELSFKVTNNTGQRLDSIEINPCFMLIDSPDFPDRKMENFYISIDGKLTSLSRTTPTPQQLGREPWVTVLLKENKETYAGQRDTHMWWMVDQLADENLMIAVSSDKKHIVGYTWNTRPFVLMNNVKHPCMHTGPGIISNLADGQSAEVFGKIYLMKNDMPLLLEKYNADHENWSRLG
ncbi:MAG: hypothetical protein ACIAQZ_11220 [Sedimentisphaeraceae bacterium JB056]